MLRIMLDPPMTLSEVNGIHRGSLQACTKLVVNLFDGEISLGYSEEPR